MSPIRISILVLLASVTWCAAPVSAQPLGTFRWQLQPYCNIISLAVVQQGSQYQLDGTDDQCGAAVKASVVGMAFQNPNGSIGFGLSIVTAPGGTPVDVYATIAIATLNGTWRDSAGNSGTLIFTPAAGIPGGPRPVGTTLLGATTEVARRGATGTQRGANGWQPDPLGSIGVWLESGTTEGGGFFANGNTAAIWSPADSQMTVRNGATASGGVLLALFDEDNLTPGSTARPDFIFANGARAIDTFTGAHLTVGGTWTNSSDRRRKKNIVKLDAHDALARLRRLPIYEWQYTVEDDGVRHVGPMAQDFHAAFGLNGNDDTHIATVDADGVLMASVVAVADDSQALREENVRLVRQLSELEARLARIERLLAGREPR